MFGKKKETTGPRPALALQLLSSEYLIEGLVFSDDLFDRAANFGDDYGGIDAFFNLQLSTVKIRPAGILPLQPRSFSQWTLSFDANLIAIIPKDDACLQAAQKAFVEYKNHVNLQVYAGTYTIQGTVLTDQTDGAICEQDYRLVPVQNARLTNLLPGAQLPALQVPWLLLNPAMIHGVGRD